MMARRPLSLLLAASAGCVLLVAQQQCAHAFVPPPTAAASAAVRPARTAGAPVQRLYAGTWMRVVCGRYIARAGMCQLMKPNTHTNRPPTLSNPVALFNPSPQSRPSRSRGRRRGTSGGSPRRGGARRTGCTWTGCRCRNCPTRSTTRSRCVRGWGFGLWRGGGEGRGCALARHVIRPH